MNDNAPKIGITASDNAVVERIEAPQGAIDVEGSGNSRIRDLSTGNGSKGLGADDSGAKWWIKYVIVPLLVAIIAGIAAYAAAH